MIAIRITTDNHVETITISDDDTNRLRELQAAVDGLIEVVSITEELDLIADEEGLIYRKPLNYYGTLIPQLFNVPVSGICGDVLLVGNTIGTDGPTFTDAPTAAYEVLAKFGFKLDHIPNPH